MARPASGGAYSSTAFTRRLWRACAGDEHADRGHHEQRAPIVCTSHSISTPTEYLTPFVTVIYTLIRLVRSRSSFPFLDLTCPGSDAHPDGAESHQQE
jgi:hypothetical protein